MALGVGQDVPRGTGPPAELAHPDVAFGGQPRDRLLPAEPAVRPRVDHLARGQSAPAPHHRCRVQLDVDSGVGPGQRDGAAEGEPGVGLVAGGVEHHDVAGAAAQRLDQAQVVVVAAVGHIHPGAAVAQAPGGLGPQQPQGGLHGPVPQRAGPPAAEPAPEHVGPQQGLPAGVLLRLAVPEQVRQQVPQQQQQRAPLPPPAGVVLVRVVDPLACLPDQVRVGQPHAEPHVGRGEQDPVGVLGHGAHQRGDRRAADRRDVEQGGPAVTQQGLVVRRPRPGALDGRGLLPAGRGLLPVGQGLVPVQGHIIRVERDAEASLPGRHLPQRVDVGCAADHQARLVPQLGQAGGGGIGEQRARLRRILLLRRLPGGGEGVGQPPPVEVVHRQPVDVRGGPREQRHRQRDDDRQQLAPGESRLGAVACPPQREQEATEHDYGAGQPRQQHLPETASQLPG